MATPTFNFGAFVCEGDFATAEVDGFLVKARIYRDDTSDAPDERDEGFWPSRDPNAAGYVLPENFAREQEKAERIMAAWKRDDWFYCGVAVTVSFDGVPLTGKFDHALWGVECNYPDSDNAYLGETAAELTAGAIDAARAEAAKIHSQLSALIS